MMKILCYNIYSPRPDEVRAKNVLRVISERNPDILCLQEVTPAWKEILTEALCGDYTFVGEGREEGRDREYNPVLFKTARFELLDTETFWLSHTPTEVSRLESSKYYRICTAAKLADRSNQSVFLATCAHLDYISEAAKEQSEILLQLMENLHCEKSFMCGDFNASKESPAYGVIATSSYQNAETIAKRKTVVPTFQKFGTREETIDFCFTKGMEVDSFAVEEVKYEGAYPSDHNPITIEMR